MSNAGLNCGLHKGDNICSEVAVSLSSWKYQSNNMLYLMVHLPQCAHFIQGKSHAGSLPSIEEHLPWHKGGFKALLVQCSSRLWRACRSRTADRSVSRITQTLFPELVYFLHSEGMQSHFKSPLCERGPKGELLRVWTSAEIQLLQLCLTSLLSSCWWPARFPLRVPGRQSVQAQGAVPSRALQLRHTPGYWLLPRSPQKWGFTLPVACGSVYPSHRYPRPRKAKSAIWNLPWTLSEAVIFMLYSCCTVDNFASRESSKSCTGRHKQSTNPLRF